MTKEKINPDDYITKREATLILGFKNFRSITQLIKKEYLKTYNIDFSKREVLKKIRGSGVASTRSSCVNQPV